MPKNLTPQDHWETDFQVPIPGEPRNIGPLETLFQRLLNRTERLRGRIAEILGLPWDATPPDTIAGLHGRVGTLEAAQGGTTLQAHRSASVLDHPNGSVTLEKLAPSALSQPGALTLLSQTGMPMTSGGVPVVESGSNDQGAWVRWADGTQMCYRRWSATSSLVATRTIQGITVYAWHPVWVYPAAFADTPVVLVSGDGPTTGSDVYGLDTITVWYGSCQELCVRVCVRGAYRS